MRARARVEVGMANGRLTYRTLRSDPPLLLRPTPIGLLMVGGAAGPLGGDDLELDIVVDAGAELTVRSAAASLALPGRQRSRLIVRAEVGEGASLDFAPEPLVSVIAGDHLQRSFVTMHGSSRLRWSETTVFGRTGEDPGRLELGLRVERDGAPIFHQDLRVGPKEADGFADFRNPAVLGGHRVLSSELVAAPDLEARERTVHLADGLWSADVAPGCRFTTKQS